MSEEKMGMTPEKLEKQVAEAIIKMMEEDGLNWVKRWYTPSPCQNGLTGHVYRGSNVFTTGLKLLQSQSTDPRFLTFKQGIQIGAKVRKGEKGTPILYYGSYVVEDEDRGREERRSRFLKVRHLFHVSQFEEIDLDRLKPIAQPPAPTGRERNAEIDAYLAATGVPIENAPAAFYSEKIDTVAMPPLDTFLDAPDADAAENYYQTLLHEFMHVTGARKRLDRETMRKYHADKRERAREELIAEIGSVMLGQRFGLMPKPRQDNAAYVASWCRMLADKPGEIFTAASAATKAIDWLDQQQPDIEE